MVCIFKLVCTNSSDTQAEARLEDGDLKFNRSMKILHTEDKQRIPGPQQIALDGLGISLSQSQSDQFDALQFPVPNENSKKLLRFSN